MGQLETARYTAFDPLLTDAEAAEMVRLCERFGSYGMYSEEPTFAGIGAGLPARYDAVRNFILSGGRFGRREPLERAAARTNYFRESYAYGDEILAAGIEPFLEHQGFVKAARELFGRPLIVPAIVFANILVPGQELAIHTDVPEFRGINRKRHPQWLIVAMHHSKLFDEWRMPIATGVAWFHDCKGGEFAFYPNGALGEPVAHEVRYNTALLMDTDSVFHGVDRVAEAGGVAVDGLRPGMRIAFRGDGEWAIVDKEKALRRYRWSELRFSISWKAYCFADEADRRAWSEHADDLSVDAVVDRMVEDLRERGVIRGERPPDRELVETIIDAYVQYPPAATPTQASSRSL
jgi:hypothetical protein